MCGLTIQRACVAPPVPAAIGVGQWGGGNLRVEHYDIVCFSHSIVASMQSKHISNDVSRERMILGRGIL